MELRHLDTLLAIAEQGSFTAAADALSTVQSNVSEQVRQLEDELGADLLVRGRRGATPTECGEVVLERARRIRRELEAMQADLSMLQGLRTGHASLGIVGTASRWMIPALVADLRSEAPGVQLRINEGASERLASEVLEKGEGCGANLLIELAVLYFPFRQKTLIGRARCCCQPVPVRLRPRVASGSCSRKPRW